MLDSSTCQLVSGVESEVYLWPALEQHCQLQPALDLHCLVEILGLHVPPWLTGKTAHHFSWGTSRPQGCFLMLRNDLEYLSLPTLTGPVANPDTSPAQP